MNGLPSKSSQPAESEEPMLDKERRTSWVQKAQLEHALREEATNSRLLRDKAHQQQRDLNILSDHLCEYNAVIVDAETRARHSAEKAMELQTAFTRERKLAATNDDYMQGIEQRCSELEIANDNLRQSSSKRERAFNRHMQDMETRVQELERELSRSSTDNKHLRQQMEKDIEDWHALRCALEASNEVEKDRIENLNRFMDGMKELLERPDLMRRAITARSGIRQLGQAPALDSFASQDVDMKDDSQTFRYSAPRKSMTICSSDSEDPPSSVSRAVSMLGGSALPLRVKNTAKGKEKDKSLEMVPTHRQAQKERSKSISPDVVVKNEQESPRILDSTAPTLDVEMRSLALTPESTVSDIMQIDEAGSETVEGIQEIPSAYYQAGMAWYDRELREHALYSSTSSDDSDYDSDSAVFSPPVAIRFPSRKRPRYTMSTDASSQAGSEPDDENVSALKRMKICPTCGQLDTPPQFNEALPSTKMANDSAQKNSASAMSVSAAIYVDSGVQMVSPVTVYSVSPKLPQHENHRRGFQESQSQDHNYFSRGAQMGESPIKSVHTQTDTPLTASSGIQVGETLQAYRKRMNPVAQVPGPHTTQQSGSSLRPQVLSLDTRSMDAHTKALMPGTWPRQSTPEGVASESDRQFGPFDSDATAKEFVAHCERIGQAAAVRLLRIIHERPQELVVSILSLAVVLYLWHGHRAHQQWMSANDMPRSVLRELRNRRVWESRWMHSLHYGLVNWLDLDRVTLG